MIRLLAVASLTLFAACADRSKGAALNECRLRYFLDSEATQSEAIPDCMRARSFEPVAACVPEPDPDEWDAQVTAFTYDNPQCYRGMEFPLRVATFLSPM